MADGSRLRAALTGDLRLKAVSLLLSVLLWLVVGVRVPDEAFVALRVEPALDSARVLVDPVPELRALVSGRTADLLRLYAAPPVVRRPVSPDAPDTVLLDIGPADIHLAADLEHRIRVLDVQPRRVRLRVETRGRIQVPSAPAP